MSLPRTTLDSRFRGMTDTGDASYALM